MTKTKQIAYLIARLTELVEIEKSGCVYGEVLLHDTRIVISAKISEIENTLQVFYGIDADKLVEMALAIKE